MRFIGVLIAALLAGESAVAAESAGAVAAPAPSRPYPKLERTAASPITDHFALRGTFFPASLGTDLHLDTAAGMPGSAVSAERDLGLKSRLNQGRMELIFRLRERHRLRADYFGSERDGDRALSRTIIFGGHTFMSTDRVQSDLQFSMLGFTYTYSLLRTERFEIGAGVGVHLLQADARGTDVTLQQHAESSGVAAFPTPALDATWAFAQRFAWTARVQYLRGSISGVSASLGDYHTDLQYRWQRNFAVGLGYEAIRVQLDDGHSNPPAGFALRIRGPELFLRASF
jgi:hypothetical protein